MPQGALIRGLAFFVDTALVGMLVALALGDKTSLPTATAVTLAANLIYFLACEGLAGTTPGKRVFGLRVVRAADGRPCGPLAATIRTALRLVDNLLLSLPGILAIATSPRRQRLGDRVAQTLVVSEVPEQLVAALDGLHGRVSPDEVLRRINRVTLGHAQPDLTPGVEDESGADDTSGAPDTPIGTAPVMAGFDDAVPCPFCDMPMPGDAIVCRSCGHYVNQVTAEGEIEEMAPAPLLYSDDRRYRFDALWRSVFLADEESLSAAREAVRTWSRAERVLAVSVFANVDDPRTEAFLDFMTKDPDEEVRTLAREVLARHTTDP